MKLLVLHLHYLGPILLSRLKTSTTPRESTFREGRGRLMVWLQFQLQLTKVRLEPYIVRLDGSQIVEGQVAQRELQFLEVRVIVVRWRRMAKSGWRESNPHGQLGRLDRGQSESSIEGDKEGFPEVSDCEVTAEVTRDPEKVRIPAPVSPSDLIQVVDACTLPDLVKHTIKTLIEPYIGSPKSPKEKNNE